MSPEPPPSPSPRPAAVRGLSAEQRERSVADLFATISWEPSVHEALSRWELARFFERFVR